MTLIVIACALLFCWFNNVTAIDHVFDIPDTFATTNGEKYGFVSGCNKRYAAFSDHAIDNIVLLSESAEFAHDFADNPAVILTAGYGSADYNTNGVSYSRKISIYENIIATGRTKSSAFPNGVVHVWWETSVGAGDWTIDSKIIAPSDSYTNQFFGSCVEVDGDLIVAGASSSAIYIFERSCPTCTDWELDETKISWTDITASVSNSNDFGESIGVHDRQIVTGLATYEETSQSTQYDNGLLVIFYESSVGAKDWISNQHHLYNTNDDGMLLGVDVAFNEQMHIVGGTYNGGPYGYDTDETLPGYVNVYSESSLGAQDWHNDVTTVSHPDPVNSGVFGLGVDLKGVYLAVADPNSDRDSTEGGEVVLFQASALGMKDWADSYVILRSAVNGKKYGGPYWGGVCLNTGGADEDVWLAVTSESNSAHINFAVNGWWNHYDCTGLNAVGEQCEIPCPNGEGFGDIDNAFEQCDCTGLDAIGVQCQKSCNNGFSVDPFDVCNCTGSGATGKLCTKDVDDCASSPCMNDGVCSDFGPDLFPAHNNEFNCTCAQGWMGPTCENTMCYSSPCMNGAVCVNGEDFACNCTNTGYEGEFCETETDECASSPCDNNGICTHSIGEFSCDCTGTGYEGDMCQFDVDDCFSSPCQNDATCKDNGTNKFQCTCVDGYEGNACENNIDECLSSPCMHEATCVDLVANFTCTCDGTGYEGRLCQDESDDCVSMPCTEGTICIDLINSYECEEPVDPCLSQPCEPPAVCMGVTDSMFECSNTVSASFTDVECPDNAGIDCTDTGVYVTYILEQLQEELGGEEEDYLVEVLPQDDGTYDITIIAADPEGVYADDAAFVTTVEDSNTVTQAVIASWTSSSFEESCYIAAPSAIVLVCAIAAQQFLQFL